MVCFVLCSCHDVFIWSVLFYVHAMMFYMVCFVLCSCHDVFIWSVLFYVHAMMYLYGLFCSMFMP